MAWDALFNLTVAFAIVTGTGAGLLALLSRDLFSQSPLGRALTVLSLLMSVFIVYHVLLVGFQSEPVFVKVLESAAYTGVVVFIAAMVVSQHQLRKRTEREQA